MGVVTGSEQLMGGRIRESSPMDLTQDGHTTSTLRSGQADASMTDKCSILYTACYLKREVGKGGVFGGPCVKSC